MNADRVPVQPSDVRRAADAVVSALSAAVDADWSVRAGKLEWSVDETIAHMTGAVGKYVLYLAGRSTRFIAVRLRPYPDATPGERLDAIRGAADALAGVADLVPPGTRAYHDTGMLDAEGYCGLACVELLVHGHDAAEGLGLALEPPADLCLAVVRRVFPWLEATEEDAWRLMLWHTGRIDLAGRESHDDDSWRLVGIPLDEWDGEMPRRGPRPAVGWTLDEEPGRWRPVYDERP